MNRPVRLWIMPRLGCRRWVRVGGGGVGGAAVVGCSGCGLPSVLANADAQINASVVRVFSGCSIASTLPVNPVTNWLEGGLLLVASRCSTRASVNASQTVNNCVAGDGSD